LIPRQFIVNGQTAVLLIADHLVGPQIALFPSHLLRQPSHDTVVKTKRTGYPLGAQTILEIEAGVVKATANFGSIGITIIAGDLALFQALVHVRARGFDGVKLPTHERHQNGVARFLVRDDDAICWSASSGHFPLGDRRDGRQTAARRTNAGVF